MVTYCVTKMIMLIKSGYNDPSRFKTCKMLQPVLSRPNSEGWMLLVNKWTLSLPMCEHRLRVCLHEVVKALLKGEWPNKDKFTGMSLAERADEIAFRKLSVCGDKMEFTLTCVCFHNGCLDVYYTSVFPDEESVCQTTLQRCVCHRSMWRKRCNRLRCARIDTANLGRVSDFFSNTLIIICTQFYTAS